ncbi:hypothetical protein ACFVUP_39065, partial [Streptomyces bacillaris]|uniref:hypothetical protein n=1 Tax=Streptomyces bacillaris TaxID=68179 RepID=UPI0036D8168F
VALEHGDSRHQDEHHRNPVSGEKSGGVREKGDIRDYGLWGAHESERSRDRGAQDDQENRGRRRAPHRLPPSSRWS